MFFAECNLFLMVSLVLISYCDAVKHIKNNTEVKPNIKITKRKYYPSSNNLIFEAECRIHNRNSLSNYRFQWFLRNYLYEPTDNNVYNYSYLFDKEMEELRIGDEIVSYVSTNVPVHFKEIELCCSFREGENNATYNNAFLFRFSKHNVINAVVLTDYLFDVTQKVDIRIEVNEPFMVSWNIDDEVLLPGTKKSNMMVLHPETDDKKIYNVSLLFSPLRTSDVMRKYELILDFLKSGDRVYYRVHIQGKNGVIKDAAIPFVIGLSVGILMVTVPAITWKYSRKCKRKVNEQKPDRIDNIAFVNNQINVNEAVIVLDKCLPNEETTREMTKPTGNNNKRVNKKISGEKGDKLYYSVPYSGVRRPIFNTATAINKDHHKNKHTYENTKKLRRKLKPPLNELKEDDSSC